MKNLIAVLALITTVAGFGQNNDKIKTLKGDINANVKSYQQITNSIDVTINYLKDIDATFSLKDIKDIIDEMPLDRDIVFSMTCNKDESSKVNYIVNGNTNDYKKFIKDVSDVREKAIRFYKNK